MGVLDRLFRHTQEVGSLTREVRELRRDVERAGNRYYD